VSADILQRLEEETKRVDKLLNKPKKVLIARHTLKEKRFVRTEQDYFSDYKDAEIWFWDLEQERGVRETFFKWLYHLERLKREQDIEGIVAEEEQEEEEEEQEGDEEEDSDRDSGEQENNDWAPMTMIIVLEMKMMKRMENKRKSFIERNCEKKWKEEEFRTFAVTSTGLWGSETMAVLGHRFVCWRSLYSSLGCHFRDQAQLAVRTDHRPSTVLLLWCLKSRCRGRQLQCAYLRARGTGSAW